MPVNCVNMAPSKKAKLSPPPQHGLSQEEIITGFVDSVRAKLMPSLEDLGKIINTSLQAKDAKILMLGKREDELVSTISELEKKIKIFVTRENLLKKMLVQEKTKVKILEKEIEILNKPNISDSAIEDELELLIASADASANPAEEDRMHSTETETQTEPDHTEEYQECAADEDVSGQRHGTEDEDVEQNNADEQFCDENEEKDFDAISNCSESEELADHDEEEGNSEVGDNAKEHSETNKLDDTTTDHFQLKIKEELLDTTEAAAELIPNINPCSNTGESEDELLLQDSSLDTLLANVESMLFWLLIIKFDQFYVFFNKSME